MPRPRRDCVLKVNIPGNDSGCTIHRTGPDAVTVSRTVLKLRRAHDVHVAAIHHYMAPSRS